MAKELDKFKQRYDKVAPKLKKLTVEEAGKLKKSFGLSVGDASASGESHMIESMANARDNGVTGDRLQDFMKDKGFKLAVEAFTIAVNQADKLQGELKAFCDEATAAAAELAKIKTDIDKDLKGRKDKSESKSEIVALGDQIEGDIKALKKTAAVWDSVPPKQRDYVANYEKTIDKILKTAPDVQERQRDATELPQMLVDRNRKQATTRAAGFARKVKEACEAAIEAAGTDLAGAQPHLKAAAASLTELKTVHDSFKKAVDYADGKRSLDGTKDEAAVRKAMSDIEKLYEMAERTLRGTATTIKKAKV
jgi:hypothetical protein